MTAVAPQTSWLRKHFVAGAGDPALPRLAGGGMILRRQPEPGRKVTAGTEPPRVGHLGSERRRRSDPPTDLGQPAALLVLAVRAINLASISRICADVPVLPGQHREHLSRKLRHPVVRFDPRKQRLDAGQALGCHQPELGGMAADRVAHLRAPLQQAVAHPNQHLSRLLLDCLDRHPPLFDLRTAHRLADRLRVGCVVLAAINIGLHVLRRDQHHPCPNARSSRAQ